MIRISALVMTIVMCAGAALAQGKITELRARLAQEPNAVNKAKLMSQLGDAEFAEIDADVTKGNFPEALDILQHYRDEVESCNKALTASGADAQRHPAGFKQLQFSLRDSLRRLDAVIVNMTSDEQAPFLAIRGDLSEANLHLIQILFPHETPAKQQSPK